MRNVEIKAKVRNLADLISRAKKISNSEGTIIPQNDTFYKVQQGRLKLRKFEDGNAELIYYERPDSEGPKTSSYEKCSIKSGEVEGLNAVLSRALGTTGIVKKVRQLFLVEQTRIHVDQVEGLGDFMELEVCLKPDQSSEEGEMVAHSLMEKLDVEKDDLLAGAYRDMLNK
ncbi:hypothetical protein ILUMI_00198 [Ignelater luminosus]|uniref:CYTH domain-containing protein n=1 Tax=Ignelater luminosus TaxID=2038154 RepID=A0A8K0GLG7_IGNLU|nr:hypothetical protein ILUMI_00198 [Ignelater luminosus]